MNLLHLLNESAVTESGVIACAVIGCVTLAGSLVIIISQIFGIIKTKNTSGTSLLTYIFFVLMGLVSLAWGMLYYFQHAIADQDWTKDTVLHQWAIIPILTYYISDIILSSTLVIIKARHMVLAKKLHMNELELASYLTDKVNKRYIKSGKKFRYWPYFGFTIYVIAFLTILVVFAVAFTVGTWDIIATQYDGEPFSETMIMTIGIIGAAAWEAISWPQFIRCIRHKDTSGISMIWAILLPMACFISLIYATLLLTVLTPGFLDWQAIGGVVFNGVIVNVGILIIKCINRHNARKRHLTEIEYTKKVLIPRYEAKIAKKKKRG